MEKKRAGDAPQIDALRKRYGAQAIDNAARVHGEDFPAVVAWADEIDPHYAKLWLDFTYGGMFRRGVLDDRTRILCVVGECFVLGEFHQAENHIRNALSAGASPREVLEVILQSTIYAGMPSFVRFIAILESALEEEGRLHEITDTQLPLPEENHG